MAAKRKVAKKASAKLSETVKVRLDIAVDPMGHYYVTGQSIPGGWLAPEDFVQEAKNELSSDCTCDSTDIETYDVTIEVKRPIENKQVADKVLAFKA